jgi:sortase A
MPRPIARSGSKALRWIQRTLLVAGIAALSVWAGQYLISTVWEAWANRVFDVEVAEDQIRPQPGTVLNPPALDGSLMGRLSIPRLHLSAMVREGVGESTLSLALGHVPSTAVPGQKGNVAIAGHRDTLFRSLRGIRKYDLIRFETRSSGSYLYQVSSMVIVDPTNISVLQASPDSELTLITCYPFNYVGSAPKRFIVKAREVDRDPRDPEGRQISFRQ